MAKIEFLVEQGVISVDVAKRLRARWVTTVDELYSRIRASEFSGDQRVVASMEDELDLKPGKLVGFRNYIAQYVSETVLNAKKPEQHPTGLRLS